MDDIKPPLDPFFTPRLNAALAIAQAEMGPAIKGRVNPAFKSKYADLASVIAACAPLGQHGIAFVQHVHTEGPAVTVGTVLRHSSGEVLDCGTMTAVAKDASPQAIGSVLTYLRRYALMAAVGVAADDDDDGNAASGRSENNNWRAEPPPQQHAPTAAANPKHHPSWAVDQAGFCAAIKRLGYEYDEVAEWCSATGKKRPSAMTVAERQTLFMQLEGLDGRLPSVAREAAPQGGK